MKNIWTTCCTAGIALAAFTGVALAAPPALGASRDPVAPTEIDGYKIKYGPYSADDSADDKAADAVCPTGTVVLGGGAEVAGAPGLIGLRKLNPHRTSEGRYRFTATAAETGHSTDGKWKMRAVAVCGKRPDGYEITNWRTSAKNHGTSFKAVKATCSPGKRPLGYGSAVSGALGNVSLRSMRVPFATRDVAVSASEAATNTFTPWSVSSRAVCAASSVGQAEKAGTWSWPQSPAVTSRTVACPADTRPLGAGMSLSADDQVRRNLLVRAVYPVILFGGGGSLVQVSEDWNGTTGSWQVLARVNCAP
ncbi:hypothetical protein ACFU96_09385 [Streptomyces sp. NPDC057620]|uniref:hypothetical protein n=1 Tax=Streptomyces sp. NPDC057620 TaxID=3346185 RepID=UPI0036BEC2B0